MATSNVFYVYEHWRLDRDECFYVGKGKGNRAYILKDRNRHHKAIMAKLNREGFAMEVRIVESGLSEEQAFDLEVERIAFWRGAGADLTNLTNGGEGVSGHILSDEAKKHLSDLNKGKPGYWKGKKLSEETRAKLSEIGKRVGPPKLSPETIEKIASYHRGKKRSAETRAKISEKAKGRPSPFKGKESPFKGIPLSSEVKTKMSIARKEWWDKKREDCGGNITGRKLSEEERRAISERKKKWWAAKKAENAQ